MLQVLFGDPNERARRRKEFYNPKKRKEAYRRTLQKIKAKHFESNLKETNEYREKYEKDGRSRNLIQFQATIDFFDNSQGCRIQVQQLYLGHNFFLLFLFLVVLSQCLL